MWIKIARGKNRNMARQNGVGSAKTVHGESVLHSVIVHHRRACLRQIEPSYKKKVVSNIRRIRWKRKRGLQRRREDAVNSGSRCNGKMRWQRCCVSREVPKNTAQTSPCREIRLAVGRGIYRVLQRDGVGDWARGCDNVRSLKAWV